MILRSTKPHYSCAAITLGTSLWSTLWKGSRSQSGIVTDRDIVVGVVAMGLDPRELTAGDIMGDDLITVPETYDVHEALTRMREEGVRRMPVVNTRGELTGIVTFDDLLPLVAEELAALARLPSTGRQRECALRH